MVSSPWLLLLGPVQQCCIPSIGVQQGLGPSVPILLPVPGEAPDELLWHGGAAVPVPRQNAAGPLAGGALPPLLLTLPQPCVALEPALGPVGRGIPHGAQRSTRAASATRPKKMVQVYSLGASSGSSWHGLFIVPASFLAWRCLSSWEHCSDDKQVSSTSSSQHLPCGPMAEPQGLAAHHQHLNALCPTRRTLTPCLHPEGSQHLTCPQKDADILC